MFLRVLVVVALTALGQLARAADHPPVQPAGETTGPAPVTARPLTAIEFPGGTAGDLAALLGVLTNQRTIAGRPYEHALPQFSCRALEPTGARLALGSGVTFEGPELSAIDAIERGVKVAICAGWLIRPTVEPGRDEAPARVSSRDQVEIPFIDYSDHPISAADLIDELRALTGLAIVVDPALPKPLGCFPVYQEAITVEETMHRLAADFGGEAVPVTVVYDLSVDADLASRCCSDSDYDQVRGRSFGPVCQRQSADGGVPCAAVGGAAGT
jgi:hypothetical protein